MHHLFINRIFLRHWRKGDYIKILLSFWNPPHFFAYFKLQKLQICWEKLISNSEVSSINCLVLTASRSLFLNVLTNENANIYLFYLQIGLFCFLLNVSWDIMDILSALYI